MREIKFRGIALWSCKWVYGYVVFDGFGAYIVPIDKPFRKEPEIPQPMNWIEVDIETVGEFTGLSDKSGKEIYEGDIVKERHHAEPGYSVGDSFSRVDFADIPHSTTKGWVLTHVGGIDGFHLSFNRSEIIGNIHKTPELIP